MTSATPMPWAPPRDPWTIEARAVVTALASDPVLGLTAEEAADRLRRYGPNELRARARKPAWRLLAEQFTNAMILVLIGAAVDHRVDRRPEGHGRHPGAIVVLNGIVGFVQEFRAERAMDALAQMTSPSARGRPRRRGRHRRGGRARAGRPRPAHDRRRRDGRHAPARGPIPADQRGRPDRRVRTGRARRPLALGSVTAAVNSPTSGTWPSAARP